MWQKNNLMFFITQLWARLCKNILVLRPKSSFKGLGKKLGLILVPVQAWTITQLMQGGPVIYFRSKPICQQTWFYMNSIYFLVWIILDGFWWKFTEWEMLHVEQV